LTVLPSIQTVYVGYKSVVNVYNIYVYIICEIINRLASIIITDNYNGNTYYTYGMAQQYKLGIVILLCIFKKGWKTHPENYRDIRLLHTSMKLFTGNLKERFETQITNREEQQGFRRNKSTTDAIFIIKQLKEKSIEFNTPAYVSFIDLTKAFDRVRLSDIINILMMRKKRQTPS